MIGLTRTGIAFAASLACAAAVFAQTPVAVDDDYGIRYRVDLVVEAPGVIGNDTYDGGPAENAGATVELIDYPTYGTLACDSDPAYDLCPDGSFIYTPGGSFPGTDSFTYRVAVGAGTDQATVALSACSGGPTRYVCWHYSAFVNKLGELGRGTFSEGFEDDAVWGATRAPMTQPSVLSQGITWQTNHPATNELTTGGGAARSGLWGVYDPDHGDATGTPAGCDVDNPPEQCLFRDGVTGTGSGTLYGAGGFFTGVAQPNLSVILDGGAATGLGRVYAGTEQFFGIIDATGFTTFRFEETDGKVGQERLVFADDFTFGGSVPVNGAPTAAADAATVDEGGTVTVLDGGGTSVLANDSDPEGSPLTAVWVGGPSHGSLTLNSDGTFSYTHDDSETTADSFQYRANDGLESSSPATVSITINLLNDNTPIADAGPDRSVVVNDVVTLDGSASNDLDGDTLSYSWTMTSMPDGSSAVLTSPNVVDPSFVADVPGAFIVQLIVNDGVHDSAPGTVTVGAAVEPAAMTGVVAGVADSLGLQGSDWHTDLYLHNASSDDVEVEIYFSPSRGTVGDPATLTVAGDNTMALDDVVSAVFGAEGSGAIFWRVVSGDPTMLMVSANTFNRVDEVRSYGQQVTGVRWDDAPGAGQPVIVPAVAGPFRTNLGFSTDGDCSQVRIRGYDRYGSLRVQRVYDVQPYTWRQLNQLFRNVFQSLVDDPDNAAVADSLHRFEVEGVDGKVVAYTSVIDNLTNDGSYMLGQWPNLAGDAPWLPGAAFTRGVNDSQWRSDVVAMNLSAGAEMAELTYFPSGGDNGGGLDIVGIEMAGDESAFEGNVLAESFGLGSPTVGSLATSCNECLFWMRTYTEEPGDGGVVTYGQAVPARGDRDTLAVEDEGRIFGFSWGDHTRSNLILQNTLRDASGSLLPLDVRVQLLDKQGVQVHQRTYSLGPGEYLQHNAFLRDYGVGWLADGALRLVVLGSARAGDGGGLLAMVSEVNGAATPGTNDGRLLTAMPVPGG